MKKLVSAVLSLSMLFSAGSLSAVAENNDQQNAGNGNEVYDFITPSKTDESIHWTFSSDGGTELGTYDYSDEYADIRVVLNTSSGDSIGENGIYFAGTGFADADKSDYSMIGQNNRYILFMPKYTGTLDISADFENCNSSTCRVYALPVEAESVETVDIEALGEIYKDSPGNGQQVAAQTSNKPSSAAQAVSTDISVESGQVYAIVAYSYKNSPSVISSFGYFSDFTQIDPDAEYTLKTVEAEGGSISFDKEKAKAGEEVNAQVSVDAGYEIGKIDIDGTTFMATGAETNSFTFIMPSKNIDENSVTAFFDEISGKIDVNSIHDFDGGIEGTSSPKSKNLFDGIVNSSSVENYADVTYGTEDDLILDAGEGGLFYLSKIIAYSKYGENSKAVFRVHASNDLDTITDPDTIVIPETSPQSSSVNSVWRGVLEPDSTVSEQGYRYIRIKYTKSSVSLSEIKIYAEMKTKPSSLDFAYNYSDGMSMYVGRRNKVEGSCYKIGNAEFTLTDETGRTVQTKTADLTGQTSWSIMLDPVEDPSGKYKLSVTSEGNEYASLSDIVFEDMPLVKIGVCEYDGEKITVPVSVMAQDVSENIRAVAAEFSDDGKLIGLAQSYTEGVENDTEIELSYARKDELSDIRLFVWDDKMKPYCDSQYIYENISGKLSAAPAGVTYDSAAIVWDKNAGESYTYEILQNGSVIGETENLYYVAEGLEADTLYSFEVRIKDGASLGTIRVKTEKKGDVLNILDYGAEAGGKIKNTEAIQAAIDACPKNGTVVIPEGTFLTGALTLHSDMTLYLENGAVLQGTASAEDYPMWDSRFEGWELESYRSLINIGELDNDGGYVCRNVHIKGEGTISGGGSALAAVTGGTEDDTTKRMRGRLISIHNAQNVSVSGITVQQPPSWMIHMVYSDRVSTYNVNFISNGVRNGDGWDPDSSTNCMVFGSVFRTGDDCIAIKSGKNPEGNIINRPTKHIRIFNCRTEETEGGSYSGLGMAIGSEMSGGVEDVTITDCDIQGTRYGLEIKASPKRGGYVKNINVKDSAFDRLLMHSVSYNDDGEAAPDMPYFSDMVFENIKVPGYEHYNGKKALNTPIELIGFELPENYIKNIVLRNITVGDETNVEKTIKMQYCDGIILDGVVQTDGNEPAYDITDSMNIENTLNALMGKKVYAFGDSIVYGHNAPAKSFMRLLADDNFMDLGMYAKNGASVVCVDSSSKEDASEETEGNYIIKQVREAPEEEPDIIVFDGYTNDAYGNKETDKYNADGGHIDITLPENLGTIQGKDAVSFDNKTFCGAFEEIIYTMKEKWPNAKIVFVTIHKSGARDWDIQQQLRSLAVDMCNEWGVSIADVFETELDTHSNSSDYQYIIGGSGSHPNESGCREFYMPVVKETIEQLYK